MFRANCFEFVTDCKTINKDKDKDKDKLNQITTQEPLYVHSSDDEINLGELFLAIWEGRWFVSAIVAITILCAIAYIALSPNRFSAELEFFPITTSDFDRYSELNTHKYFPVTKQSMLSLFAEELKKRDAFISSIEKYGLVDRNKYDTDVDYENNIRLASYNFEILPPIKGENKREERDNWLIRFESDDKELFFSALENSFQIANNSVREDIYKRFFAKVDVSKRAGQYKIDDINKQISNDKYFYETKTINRLAFLNEQSEIARTLGIAKNTIEAQSYKASNSVVMSVKTDVPFYLRGYEAIEKEIKLIKDRSNKDAFISNLVKLEQQKRSILQNETIDRAVAAFNNTPIAKKDNFKSAHFDLASTEIKYKLKPKLILVLSLILGCMLGLFLLFVRNAIRSQTSA